VCGIAGIFAFNPSGEFDEQVLRDMVERIRHRGPDDSAVLHRGRVGVGISRLAIIDPAGSQQPIFNEDGSVFMVFNGEIYNYKQLRSQLETAGHRFVTKGDGESVVHGYEEWGTGVFERLRGMFAVAIYDENRRHLLLARDRIGIKPLYLHNDGNRLVFASEIKAMLEAGVDARFRRGALDCYLAFRYVPAPDTIFDGVRKLPPGEFLVVDESGETRGCFHTVSLRPKHAVSESEASEHLFQLLNRSVEYRLQSDVPLGVFLSGGLDSGFLVALARTHTREDLDTFSIGFNRAGIFDETEAAGVVARRFSTIQHSIKMDHAEFVARLPSAVYHMDEPMADPSSVPMQALSELAGRYVKVVLSGEGGDELFAGYGRYVGESIASRYSWPEKPSRWLAHSLRRRLSRTIRRGIEGIGIGDRNRRHLFWEEIVYGGQRRRLLGPAASAATDEIDPLAAIVSTSNELDAGDDLDHLFHYDIKRWLVEDLLLKKDKMGMSASIEARVPYLDQDVVEYAIKLPSSLKIRGRRRKYIFRRLLSEHLPRDILERPKVGFAVPLESWFRHELSEVLRSQLTGKDAFVNDVLDAVAVEELLDAHAAGEDLSLALYTLLVLELWGRIYLRAESAEDLSSELQEATAKNLR
jgi:asparagine synthase (glutamine-hydrolysing)